MRADTNAPAPLCYCEQMYDRNLFTMPACLMSFPGRFILLSAVIGGAALYAPGYACAQDLEPRAYANAPVGMNFILVGYQYSNGALLFDPALPITDANADINLGLIGYVHTLGIAGHSAKVGALLPVADLSGDGYLSGVYRSRVTSGMADPSFYFSINFHGAPALSFKEFKDYRQDTIVGFTFKVTAPLGVYEPSKLINIGTNRWSFKPEFGISRAIGRWVFEGAASAVFYTDNNDFDTGKTRQQDPIYSAQGHVIYTFPGNKWMAVGATYYTGGRTRVDGIRKNDLQDNWRLGFTAAFPVSRQHAIKVIGSGGVSTRTGTDYDSIALVWQYRWTQ